MDPSGMEFFTNEEEFKKRMKVIRGEAEERRVRIQRIRNVFIMLLFATGCALFRYSTVMLNKLLI